MKRVAVVGLGSRAQMWVRALAERGRLVAFCDSTPHRMRVHNDWLTETGHPAVPEYPAADFQRMLTECRADAVVVCTPDATHADYVVAALAAGCDVVVEKPLATTEADLRRIWLAERASTEPAGRPSTEPAGQPPTEPAGQASMDPAEPASTEPAGRASTELAERASTELAGRAPTGPAEPGSAGLAGRASTELAGRASTESAGRAPTEPAGRASTELAGRASTELAEPVSTEPAGHVSIGRPRAPLQSRNDPAPPEGSENTRSTRANGPFARTRAQVRVAFNYRYNPVHARVRELIAGGVVGEIGSVHFEWCLDLHHGADYFRRWHRDRRVSGGLLVHKSTHHFDLVSWWTGLDPATVYAQGRLFHYGPPGPADGEDGFALDLSESPRLARLYGGAPGGYRRDLSPFAPGVSIEDDLAVLVRFGSGATMTYHLTAYSPWEGYRVAINGSRGRLELDVQENDWVRPGGAAARLSRDVPPEYRLTVRPLWSEPYEVAVSGVTGAHGGGDERMLADVLDEPAADPLGRAADSLGRAADSLGRAADSLGRAADPLGRASDPLGRAADPLGPAADPQGPAADPLGRAAGSVDGIRSIVIGLCANESIRTGAVVDAEAVRARILAGTG